MQAATRVAVTAFLFTSALATLHQNTAKLRRDGVLNLYPFPRVGRGSPHQTWELPLNDLYIEYKPSQKRQLYAFPRVGRSGALRHSPLIDPLTLEQFILEHSGSHGKRAIESEKDPGMWFGPRLGRSPRSEADAEGESAAQSFQNSGDLEDPTDQMIDVREKRHTN